MNVQGKLVDDLKDRGDYMWLSSGGSGVTDSRTGLPVPVKEFAALAFLCPDCGDYGAVGVWDGVGEKHGHNWEWDGNRELPTLSPSIQRMDGCKWHGHLVAGVWVPC